MMDLKKPMSINMPGFRINMDEDISPQISKEINTKLDLLHMECQETVDSFIFSYIMSYVDRISTVSVSKFELMEAVRYLELKKSVDSNFDISDIISDTIKLNNTAHILQDIYDRGFEDGYKKAKEKSDE